MSTTVIAVEGVLRKPVGGYLIPEAHRLYSSMCMTGHVLLLTRDPVDRVSDWLDQEGLVNHDDISHLEEGASFTGKVVYLRGISRYNVDLVITADPEDATRLITAGFNTMLYTHAQFAHPDWRPDAPKGVKPWNELSQQVADNAKRKAEDARLRVRND